MEGGFSDAAVMRLSPSLLLSAFALGFPLGVAGCDSSSNDSEAAVEARIEREREDAAQDARQAQRIRELEKKAAETAKSRTVTQLQSAPAAPAAAAPGPTASAPAEGTVSDWPGGSGQSVVLASLSTRTQAEGVQARATSAGLDAGVLRSNDYSSLRPGYWVVFSGKFESAELASQRQSRARSLGFGDAYVRFIAP